MSDSVTVTTDRVAHDRTQLGADVTASERAVSMQQAREQARQSFSPSESLSYDSRRYAETMGSRAAPLL